MKVFFYLLLFCHSIFLISCSTKRGDFSIKAPHGWEVIDTVSVRYGRYVNMHPPVYSKTPIFVENINISIVNFPSLDIYRFSTHQYIKSNAVYFEEKGKGKVKVNGYEMEWEHHIIQYKNSERTVEQKVYFIWRKGNIYQIVCTTKEKEMEDFQFRFDEVIKSFRILE
jgi:hypothetical protein